jgi:hypothetical protein
VDATDERNNAEVIFANHFIFVAKAGAPLPLRFTESASTDDHEEEAYMSQTDWAKKYAEMDKRIAWKYEQLPKGEQLGKQPERA